MVHYYITSSPWDMVLSWQHSYIVYLFPFTWRQHRFDATLVNTHTDTNIDRKLLNSYTISSARPKQLRPQSLSCI